jgi:hypothetical protein
MSFQFFETRIRKKMQPLEKLLAKITETSPPIATVCAAYLLYLVRDCDNEGHTRVFPNRGD